MMSRKLLANIAICFSLLSAGCSSPGVKTAYYSILNDDKNEYSAECTDECIYVISKILVPSELESGGIAYYKDGRLIKSGSNEWVNNLSIMLNSVLTTTVNEYGNGKFLAGTALFESDNAQKNVRLLHMYITEFNGSKEGGAVISGHYAITKGKKIITKSFSKRIPQKTDGYDALVESLSRGWKEFCVEFAKDL